MSDVRFRLNGEDCQATAGTRLVDFLAARGIDPERIALERNREVVPRERQAELRLAEGDVFEVVHFVGGG